MSESDNMVMFDKRELRKVAAIIEEYNEMLQCFDSMKNASKKFACEINKTHNRLESLAFNHINIDFNKYIGALDDESPIVGMDIDMDIDSVGFTKRTRNVLYQAGIETVKDLLGETDYGLLKLQNCGKVSITEIKTYLSENGFKLRQ